MLGLVSQAFLGIAMLLLLGSAVELRTAWRFGRLRPGRASDAGGVEVEGTIDADHGVLEAPLSKTPCVLFSCILIRRRLDHSGRQALLFSEQRPFVFATADARLPVDLKTGAVVVTGLDADERALPFLPQSILGLLVQRFGHMGHVWAEEYVVSGRESCIAAGARVFGYVKDGVLMTVSTKPMGMLGRAALVRAGQAMAVSLPLVGLGLWLRTL
jgi:hypothetical protein